MFIFHGVCVSKVSFFKTVVDESENIFSSRYNASLKQKALSKPLSIETKEINLAGRKIVLSPSEEMELFMQNMETWIEILKARARSQRLKDTNKEMACKPTDRADTTQQTHTAVEESVAVDGSKKDANESVHKTQNDNNIGKDGNQQKNVETATNESKKEVDCETLRSEDVRPLRQKNDFGKVSFQKTNRGYSRQLFDKKTDAKNESEALHMRSGKKRKQKFDEFDMFAKERKTDEKSTPRRQIKIIDGLQSMPADLFKSQMKRMPRIPKVNKDRITSTAVRIPFG